MDKLIITNNSLVYKKYDEKIKTTYFPDYTYLQILEYVRDKIHQGHKLLTHPLYGSIKPNETPLRSIMISEKKEKIDFNNVSIIEESIESAKKFMNSRLTPMWTEEILNDFSIIDLSLMENTINKMNGL